MHNSMNLDKVPKVKKNITKVLFLFFILKHIMLDLLSLFYSLLVVIVAFILGNNVQNLNISYKLNQIPIELL